MAKIHKSCGNCCENSAYLVSTISAVKNEVGSSTGDDDKWTNISISDALSSLFSFWCGSKVNDPFVTFPLQLCPKCATIFQEMYKISIQFQALGGSGNGSEVSKRLKILRVKVTRGHPTSSTVKSSEGRGQRSLTPKIRSNVDIGFDPEGDEEEGGQIKEEPLSDGDEAVWMGGDGEIFGDHNEDDEMDQFTRDPLKLFETEETLHHNESCSDFSPPSDFVEYKNPDDLQCSFCSKKFDSVFANIRHFRQFHDKDFANSDLPKCGEGNPPGHDLGEGSSPIRMTTNILKKFPCSVCGKDFGSRALLNTHLITHTDQKNHPCPKCGKRFRTPGNLKNHDLLVHIKERKIICTLCGASFVRKSHLDKHVAALHVQPRFACDTCGVSYPREDSLAVHVKIHESRNAHDLQCPICSKFFGRKSTVKLHMRKMHQGKV